MRPSIGSLLLLGCLVLAGCGRSRERAEVPLQPTGAPDPEPDWQTRAAALHDGLLLCLGDHGEIRAWELTSGEYAGDRAAQLSRKGLTQIAAASDQLWAADAGRLYRWSRKGFTWEKAAEFDGDGEEVNAIVPVGGEPLLVFPSKVVAPTAKQTFKVPESRSPLHQPPLRILATHGTDSMLWIGTGKGEWGGVLIGLDPGMGRWVEHYDPGLYVTGITHATPDEVIVSWSMSHFREHTQVQVHKADATVKTDHPELDEKYYQQIAYSLHDETLYGIESHDVVVVKDGEPSKVARLDGQLFERERQAMGVAPGLLALIPTGPKTLAIIPKRGSPWRLGEGQLIRLVKQ